MQTFIKQNLPKKKKIYVLYPKISAAENAMVNSHGVRVRMVQGLQIYLYRTFTYIAS